MEEHRVELLGPSFLMYADETGITNATAIFALGTGQFEVPLSSTTFTKVDGKPIGGPKLVAINIARPPTGIIMPLHPEKDLIAGPYAWGILQPPPDVGAAFELQILAGGKEEVVLFSNIAPGKGSAAIINTTLLENGAVYNDLDVELLNVSYVIPGSGVKETPIVGRGEDTGGVFTGDIVSFDIRSDAGPEKWGPDRMVTTSKGLPIIVFGTALEPMLAVVREVGPPEIFKLVRIP